MPTYVVSVETSPADRFERIFAFADDDAAIAYALPIARGGLVEIRREDKLIATVDERPCLTRNLAA